MNKNVLPLDRKNDKCLASFAQLNTFHFNAMSKNKALANVDSFIILFNGLGYASIGSFLS
jgi:hypothetical protein